MNREIEVRSIPNIFENDVRFVYYRLKSPLFFERLFAKKGFLKKAYTVYTGYSPLFDADEYVELVDKLKTYDDVKAWKREQKELYLKTKYRNQMKWNKR